MTRERHGEKRIQRLDGTDCQRRRFKLVIFAETLTEEIADGSFDAGRLLAVPVHAQHDGLQMIWIAAGNGAPEVRDLAGAVFIK